MTSSAPQPLLHGELSHALWTPATHRLNLSDDSTALPSDPSTDLVPSSGAAPDNVLYTWQSLQRRLHRQVACEEWLSELPPASQLVHRIEQLEESAVLNVHLMRPLNPALPVLLFDSPSVSQLVHPQHYTALVERYNEAAQGEPRDRLVYRLLVTCNFISVGVAGAMLLCYGQMWDRRLALSVVLTVSMLLFVVSAVLLYRLTHKLWQATVRRVVGALKSANVELDKRYDELVSSSAGEGAVQRHCAWRWLTLKGARRSLTTYTVGLVFTDQASSRRDETL